MTRSFRRVFQGTAIVHGAVLALLVLTQWLLLGARPLKLKEDIQFIDLAEGGGGDAGPAAPPETKAPPVIKPPEDVAPPPPEPPQDDVIPEPVKPKPTPKPKSKPKPIPQVKVPAAPRTNQLVKTKSNRPHLSQDQIRALLSGSVKGVGSSHAASSGRRGSGGSSGNGSSDSPVAWYYAMVRQIMYEAWQQPSGLANAGNPTTTVTIRVQRDGTISAWDITRPSDNSLMDESVKKAVQSVHRLQPLPPQFIGPAQDITIQFELEKLLM